MRASAKRASRSKVRISVRDLERLAQIAERDLEGYFQRNPRKRVLEPRVLAVALCQGAALHFVDGKNGVKDFDVYTFFAGRTGPKYPPRVRRIADFGSAKFGQSDDKREYGGRRIDLLGRSLPVPPKANPVNALREYLSAGDTKTAQCLSQKAVVLLRPKRLLGTVAWPES